jgi:methylated-DNA-[protein]-cysteine S-methyltransferase
MRPKQAVTIKHTYRYDFPTAFGAAAIIFRKQDHPIEGIVLPGTDDRPAGAATGDTVRLITRPPQVVTVLCRYIEAYFSGNPIVTPWEILDLDALTPLQQKVLRTVATVPYGHTQTYGRIAARIGRPGAARFVGTTLRKNPFPVVIPCHRIILSDGSPGAFAGGMEGMQLKKRMLALERSSGHEQGKPHRRKKISA